MTADIVSYLTKVKEIVNHAIEHTEEKAPVIVTYPSMGTEHAIREAAKDCVLRSMNIAPYKAIDKTFLSYKHNAEDDPYNHHLLIVNSIDTLCHPEWKNNDKLALAARRFNQLKAYAKANGKKLIVRSFKNPENDTTTENPFD